MPDVGQLVGIAVVEYDGCYLVGTRQAGQALAGTAEFPGGKCLPCETAQDCAIRECREEAGVSVRPIARLYACRQVYPHGTVDLEFWLCRPAGDIPGKLAGGFQWLPAQSLKSLEFPEANSPVVEALTAGTRIGS